MRLFRMMIFGKMYKLRYDLTWVIKWDQKRLQKDRVNALRVRNMIELLLIDPFSSILQIKKLFPKGENKFRMRVWGYRVIYSIDVGNKIILIHRIAPRKDIYR